MLLFIYIFKAQSLFSRRVAPMVSHGIIVEKAGFNLSIGNVSIDYLQYRKESFLYSIIFLPKEGKMPNGLEHKVVLHEKSFIEEGGEQAFPNLYNMGIVVSLLNSGKKPNNKPNQEKINQDLNLKASCMGATHIFKIIYLIDPNKEHLYGAVGTAYKSQKPI